MLRLNVHVSLMFSGVTIGFRNEDVVVQESAGLAELVAWLTGGQPGVNVQVQFSTSPNTAQGLLTQRTKSTST